tara:strand:- start:1172 stop:1963 length:792 start_codon:yes stop_codon:yes gene_type:complete
MTTNNTTTATRKDFAGLVANFYRAHEALSLLADDVNYSVSKGDPVDDAYDIAARAIRETPAPDFAAVVDKLYIALHTYADSQINADAIKSIIADISALTGKPTFNPASWLCRWVDYDGGYVVQDGKAKLLCPAGNASRLRCKLLQELDDMSGREALDAYIMAWADHEAQGQPATDFDALKQAVADAYAKANDRNSTEAEVNASTDNFNAELQAMMAYPATSGAQLAYKLKAFRDFECGEYVEEIRNPMLDAFEADALRLTDQA